MSLSTIGIPYPLLRPDITSLAEFIAIPTVNLPDGRKISFTDSDYSYEFITVTSVLAEDSPRIIYPDDNGSSGKVWIRTSQVEISGAINSAGEWLLSPKPDNEIVINSVSDFAVQDATTITLEENKTYVPGAPIVTSKRFILSKNVAIFGASEVMWEYTGTGAMFTGVDIELFNINNFSVKCLNAEIFNLSDTTTPITLFSASNFIAKIDSGFTKTVNKFGTFEDIASFLLSTIAVNCDSGITLIGTLGFLSFQGGSIASNDSGFIALDLGTTVVQTFFNVSTFAFLGLTSGSIGISGAVDSANVGPNIQANFSDCTFAGSTIPLVGLDPTDLQIQFRNSFPVQDSTIDFFSFMQNPRTVEILTTGTFVPIAGGSWDTTKSSRWSVDNDGVATYLYPRDTDIQMTANASLTKTGGGSNMIAMRINVDTGSGFLVIPPIRTEAITESSSPTNVTSSDIITISEGDRVRIEVTNMTSDNDVLVSANARFMSINGF